VDKYAVYVSIECVVWLNVLLPVLITFTSQTVSCYRIMLTVKVVNPSTILGYLKLSAPFTNDFLTIIQSYKQM